jgi:hypothetical protein
LYYVYHQNCDPAKAAWKKHQAVTTGDNMTVMVKLESTEDTTQTFLPNNFRIFEFDVKILFKTPACSGHLESTVFQNYGL